MSRNLDSLRGLAAIVVLVGHGYQIFIAPIYPLFFPIFSLLAQAAVMLFFVLSGFLITKSLTRNIFLNGRLDVGKYAVDRFDRLYPPLLFSMVLLLAIHLIAPYLLHSGTGQFVHSGGFISRSGLQIEWPAFFGTLVFANGFAVGNLSANTPLWSLSYEVWYYLIACLLVWRPYSGVALGIVVALVLGSLNKTFAVYGVVWFSGAIVALMHNHNVKCHGTAVVLAFLLALFAAATAVKFVRISINVTDIDVYRYHYIVLFNVFIGILAATYLYLISIGIFSFDLDIAETSKFSYTLYIVHFPILLLLYGLGQPFIYDNVVASVCAGAAAVLICLILAIFLAPWLESVRPLRKTVVWNRRRVLAGEP
ncbi:acyltransferase family protein [Ancylobacter sp.]|uniref:acyltransferase family protein n=1 Tax=Ancylobacter sp. TaxID=1872567 RepID=UPI003D138909